MDTKSNKASRRTAQRARHSNGQKDTGQKISQSSQSSGQTGTTSQTSANIEKNEIMCNAATPALTHSLAVGNYFTSPIYTADKPEFLNAIIDVTEEHLKQVRANEQLNEIYPVRMTNNIYTDPRLSDFIKFVGEQSWYILFNQGYKMQQLSTVIESMWCQEHYKHSLMEQHAHTNPVQIVGFYFIECPEKCSNVVFHDPRAGKVQASLPENDPKFITAASNNVGFTPKPGQLFFTNSWLAHSFSRHASESPIKFIHFNIEVRPTIISNPQVEIV